MIWRVVCVVGWLAIYVTQARAEPSQEIESPNENELELVVQAGHTFPVLQVALSADGRLALTGSADGMAILWDTATGLKLRSYDTHRELMYGAAFVGDGRRFVTIGSEGSAKLWDVVSGKTLRTYAHDPPEASLCGPAVSADGRRLLTGSFDRRAVLWDLETGQKLREFPDHIRLLAHVALSSDGRLALTGTCDGVVSLWDTSSGKSLRTFSKSTRGITSVSFSPDDQRALISSFDSTVYLWDVRNGDTIGTFSGREMAIPVAQFSADGRRVFTGGLNRWGTSWDAETGQKLQSFAGREFGVMNLSASADGRRLLTCSQDDTATFWNADTGEPLRTFAGHLSRVASVALSQNDRFILTGSANGTAMLWDVQRSGPPRLLLGHTLAINSVSISADGRRGLTGSDDRRAILWDLESGRRLRTFEDRDKIVAAALANDCRVVLTATVDRASLWNVETGKKTRSFDIYKNSSKSVALSPGGQRVLAVSAHGSGVVWDAQDGRALQEFGINRFTSHAMFSPDERLVVSQAFTGQGSLGMVSNTETGAVLQTFVQPNKANAFSMALNCDASRVLTGTFQRTANLWSSETGKIEQSFAGHLGIVNGVAISYEGPHIVSGSNDGTTRIWDVATGNELAALISLDAGESWLVITPDGYFDGSANCDAFVRYRKPATLDFVPLEDVRSRFYRPGLLTKIWNQAEFPQANSPSQPE
jgi:WD40 repeat protein